MSKSYSEGDKVKWKWGDDWAHGKITKVYTSKTTRKIDGNEVTREASDDDPAYMIATDDSRALKSHSEVQKDS